MEEFLLLFTGSIGLVTTVILLAFYRTNKMVNLYLIIILLYVSIYALLKSSYALGIQTFANEKILGYKQLSVFSFPLLYLFFKEILNLSKIERPIPWIHYILPLLFFASFRILSHLKFLTNEIVGLFYVVYFLINIGYLMASLKLIRPYLNKRSLKELLLNSGHQKERWILFLFCIWILLCLRVLILLILDAANGAPTGFDRGIGLWSILIIAAFVKLLITPELLYGFNVLEKKMKTHSSTTQKTILLDIWKLDEVIQLNNRQDKLLAPKISENLFENILKIEHLVVNDKIFRNPDFDITMLSKKINIPKSHLTFIFKYHCTLFFPDFRKMLQIKDAEKLIYDGYLAENTLDSLSHRVGFSSYSPFFIAFKKYTGLSPNNYSNK